MKKNYHDGCLLMCEPIAKTNYIQLQAPYIILPLKWDHSDECKEFESKLKELLKEYFDPRLLSEFI